MGLTGKQLNHLRGLAHHLKPVVTVGVAGATPAVSVELKHALTAHELVKVRLPSLSKPQKAELLERLCQETGAISVQLIGRVGVAYRPAPIPRIHLA
mgnify:FL=1|jgi:RNA-binding protein